VSRPHVHVPKRGQEPTVVSRLVEQRAAPEVDELRDVRRPVDLGDFVEDRTQEIVQRDLSVTRTTRSWISLRVSRSWGRRSGSPERGEEALR
jgi:hypothetical protein